MKDSVGSKVVSSIVRAEGKIDHVPCQLQHALSLRLRRRGQAAHPTDDAWLDERPGEIGDLLAVWRPEECHQVAFVISSALRAWQDR